MRRIERGTARSSCGRASSRSFSEARTISLASARSWHLLPSPEALSHRLQAIPNARAPSNTARMVSCIENTEGAQPSLRRLASQAGMEPVLLQGSGWEGKSGSRSARRAVPISRTCRVGGDRQTCPLTNASISSSLGKLPGDKRAPLRTGRAIAPWATGASSPRGCPVLRGQIAVNRVFQDWGVGESSQVEIISQIDEQESDSMRKGRMARSESLPVQEVRNQHSSR